MAHEDFGPRTTTRGCILGTLLVFFATFLCVMSFVLMVDNTCERIINAWMPPYPNAEPIYQSNNFFRPFAMGVTVWEQQTSDPPEQVRDWYINWRLGTGGQQYGTLATMLWDVQPAPNGNGSLIALASSCAATADF